MNNLSGSVDSPYDGQSIDDSTSEPDTPSFEIALQNILGPALDSTAWKLKSLQESQIDLTTQLNILERILNSYNLATPPAQVKETLGKINTCRQKLRLINSIIGTVEERLEKVLQRLHEMRGVTNY